MDGIFRIRIPPFALQSGSLHQLIPELQSGTGLRGNSRELYVEAARKNLVYSLQLSINTDILRKMKIDFHVNRFPNVSSDVIDR